MKKIKFLLRLYRKEVVLGLVVFLVSSLSFGLGYFANRKYNRAPIIIEQCAEIHQSNQPKTRP